MVNTMITDLLIDVGGTGIKGTACTLDRQTGSILEFPAHADAPQDRLLAHFADILRSLAGENRIRCVAMAFPGPFDYDRGIPYMQGIGKYESIYGICLPEALSALGIRAERWVFINDVSAYALGVASLLPAKHRALAVCLGTGAGSAFLIDGKLCTDASEGIPENGWIYALPYRDSIVDDYLSDRGIRRLSRSLLGQEHSPRELNDGNPYAEPVWQAFGKDAAAALLPVFQAFRPTDFVTGGKICLAWERFGGPLEDLCRNLGIRHHLACGTSLPTINGLKLLAVP